jgi:hypothetical protein
MIRARLTRGGMRLRAAGSRACDTFARHRHGTWLLLFALVFVLLWLLAGWSGVPNGTGRGVLVGAAAGLACSWLVPLDRRAMARG